MLGVVAVAVGIAAATGGCGTASPHARLVAFRAPTRSYADPAGWKVRFPVGFHLEVADQEQGVAMTEGTVANFATRAGVVVHKLRNGGSVRVVPPLGHGGWFPADGVAFRVVNDASDPFVPPHHPAPRLPIRLKSFQSSKVVSSTLGYNGTTGETFNARYHGAPRSLLRNVIVNGGLYQLVVWIGPRADAHEEAAIRRVVASVRFSPSHHVAARSPRRPPAIRSRAFTPSLSASRPPRGCAPVRRTQHGC